MKPVYKWVWKPLPDRRSIRSFKYMLPPLGEIASLGEAWTPIIRSDRMFRDNVYFKDEGRNPTGSFRDRAASLVISYAYVKGYRRIILASDGNMGVSVAAYSARRGLRTTIYVPRNTDMEKILLMKAYGARVVVSDKDLDTLLRDIESEASERDLYNASSTYNILSVEGLKTISYEIVLDGYKPDMIYLPLGSGLTLLSIYYGYRELLDHGIVDHMPKLIGVETCANPVYALKLGLIDKPCREKGLPGLSYRKPIIMDHVLEILRKHGDIVVVTRRKTVDAAKKLSRLEGLFVEPSSAVALAGALENPPLGEETLILLTGHGLKGPTIYMRGSRRRIPHIFPGATKYLILELIKENPGLTGYEIWKKLGLRISVQAVYQHLKDLREKGYIVSKLEYGKIKYYPKT